MDVHHFLSIVVEFASFLFNGFNFNFDLHAVYEYNIRLWRKYGGIV